MRGGRGCRASRGREDCRACEECKCRTAAGTLFLDDSESVGMRMDLGFVDKCQRGDKVEGNTLFLDEHGLLSWHKA